MPKSFYVKEEKQNFKFTPGKGGSLISIDRPQPQIPLLVPKKGPPAKVISSPFFKDSTVQDTSYLTSLKKKRAKAIVSKDYK